MLAPAYAPPSRGLIRSVLGITPTGPEQTEILDCRAPFIIVSGGEQGGKSFLAAWYLVEKVYELDRPGIYWLVGRKYENCFKEWEYLLTFFRKLGILDEDATSKTDPSKPRRMYLEDGTVIRTISVYETQNIIAEAPDGILACEASQLPFEGYEKLRARAAASGGWLIMTGTFEMNEQPWYPALFEEWQLRSDDHRAFLLPSWSNTVIYPGGRQDPKLLALEEDTTHEFFEERIAGLVRKPKDLVFRDYFLADRHVRRCPFLPDFPVHIAMDPGYSQGAHAMLAIQKPPGSPLRVFAEVYGTAISCEDMIEIAQNMEWWANVGDISTIDIQATRWQQGTTPPALVWQHRTGLVLRSKHVGIMDGIDRLKTFLKLDQQGQPKVIFDPSCYGLLSELGLCKSPLSGKMDAYRYRMKDGVVQGVRPLDRANHSIKALIYWLVIVFGYVTISKESRVIKAKSW